MKTFNTVAIALGMAASAAAQSSEEVGTTAMPTGDVIYVTYPGGVDSQTLVGSIVQVESQITTVVVGCPDGTDQNDCGFNPPVTVVAGPTTLRFGLVELDNEPPFTQDCSFNSNGGVCTVTAAADGDVTGREVSVVTTTTSFGPEDVQSFPVTITAGQTGGSNGGGSSTTVGTVRTTSGAGSGNSNGNGGSSSSSTTSNTSNDAKILIPGTFGAALMGLAAIYL